MFYIRGTFVAVLIRVLYMIERRTDVGLETLSSSPCAYYVITKLCERTKSRKTYRNEDRLSECFSNSEASPIKEKRDSHIIENTACVTATIERSTLNNLNDVCGASLSLLLSLPWNRSFCRVLDGFDRITHMTFRELSFECDVSCDTTNGCDGCDSCEQSCLIDEQSSADAHLTMEINETRLRKGHPEQRRLKLPIGDPIGWYGAILAKPISTTATNQKSIIDMARVSFAVRHSNGATIATTTITFESNRKNSRAKFNAKTRNQFIIAFLFRSNSLISCTDHDRT